MYLKSSNLTTILIFTIVNYVNFRKMFNEYLCRNFVADKILTQIQTPLISKRVGKPFQKTEGEHPSASKRKSRADLDDVKEDLLSDPGSSNYRDWLTKYLFINFCA